MRMVQFDSVWVNPAHVVAIRPQHDDRHKAVLVFVNGLTEFITEEPHNARSLLESAARASAAALADVRR